MANICMNYFSLQWDAEHKNYAADMKKFGRLIAYAQYRYNIHSKGTRLKDNWIADVLIDEDYEETLNMGSYTSRWAPVEEDDYQEMFTLFESLVSLQVYYDEPMMGVYGRHNMTRKGGLGLEITRVKPEFEILTILRDSSENGYTSIGDAAEKAGLDEADIQDALDRAGFNLSDFNWQMEIFDVEDYLITN